jgi:hypothetical protein
VEWRLLDALGTEEIIIGGLRPDMFATEDGQLHPGQLGVAMAAPYGGAFAPQISEEPFPYDGYNGNGRSPMLSERLDARGEEMQQTLSAYSRLLGDWMGFTEEKWRAISDSQLGWKPLRGRWNGWPVWRRKRRRGWGGRRRRILLKRWRGTWAVGRGSGVGGRGSVVGELALGVGCRVNARDH